MMLVLLNLRNLFAILRPITNYDLGSVTVMVERILVRYYGIPAESKRYIPVHFSMQYEELVHRELSKVLPMLKYQSVQGKTIYVDVTVNGTLILSTEELKDGYAIFQSC